ncbi:MAG TPA: hypothetical protein DEQ32_09355 [Gammaproteobacteria bacterium]|nr:hypothetical protein [Gammaproteobacteria bacterium]
MRYVVVLAVVVGLVIFFNVEEETSEVSSSESLTDVNDSAFSFKEILNEDSELADLKKLLPISVSEEELIEEEIIRRAALSPSADGICPNPQADVLKREAAWLKEEYNKDPENNFYLPRQNPEKIVRFASATASLANLENDYVIARNLLLDEAILAAKAAIIEQIHVQMTAESYTDFPQGTMAPSEAIRQKGIEVKGRKEEAKKEMEALDKELERVSTAVLRADEDAMSGIGFTDRLGAFIDAASKKLDESYNKQGITIEEKELVERLQVRLQELEAEKRSLAADLKDMDKEIVPYANAIVTGTKVEQIASSSLYGSRILKQWFCYDASTRSAALRVRLVWSTQLHDEAEGILTRRVNKLEPKKDSVPFTDHLIGMDKSQPTVNSHIDPNGNLWWYTVRHRPYDWNLDANRQERAAKLMADGMLDLSLFSEVFSQSSAGEFLIKNQDSSNPRSFVIDNFVGQMRAEAKNIAGSKVGQSFPVESPVDGADLLAYVSWIDAATAAASEEIVKKIEATNMRFHQDQSYWKGKVAGMRAAGASTKNDAEAFQRGFNEGAEGVMTAAKEDPIEEPDTQATQSKGLSKEKKSAEKSLRWESEVSDDF